MTGLAGAEPALIQKLALVSNSRFFTKEKDTRETVIDEHDHHDSRLQIGVLKTYFAVRASSSAHKGFKTQQ